MEKSTSYRYEALNDKSYQKLSEFAARAAVATTTLYPKHKTVVISATDAELDFIGRTGKFIDDNGLDFHITPIERSGDPIEAIIADETIDAESLRQLVIEFKEYRDKLVKEHNDRVNDLHSEIDETVKKLNDASRERDQYADLWKVAHTRSSRVREQIEAIAVLMNSIYSKD